MSAGRRDIARPFLGESLSSLSLSRAPQFARVARFIFYQTRRPTLLSHLLCAETHRIQYFRGVCRATYLPSIFGGCISALSPIPSRRQLQTRRPITVSDEGVLGTRKLPFFGIACKYLDLILFVRKLCLPTCSFCKLIRETSGWGTAKVRGAGEKLASNAR